MKYLLIVSITLLAFVTCDTVFKMDSNGDHVRNDEDQPVVVPIGQKEIAKNQLIVLIILFGILTFDDKKIYTDCVNPCNTCKAELQADCKLGKCIAGYECDDGFKLNNINQCVRDEECPKFENGTKTILDDINDFIQANARKNLNYDQLAYLSVMARVHFS